MLVVAYALNDKQLSNEDFIYHLKTLPIAFRDKITKFHNWKDSQASLFGKLLLKHILAMYESQYTLNDILLTANGRPYISNSFDFNITHSGSYVICAYSNEGRIGVDIEAIKPIDLSHFESIFTQDEFNQILASTNKQLSFYNFWTIKEAAIKADGRGLMIPLRNVKIDGETVLIEDQKWFYTKIDFREDYILHIATNSHISTPLQLVQLYFKEGVKKN